jgi:DNA-binding NtrC family response regulator
MTSLLRARESRDSLTPPAGLRGSTGPARPPRVVGRAPASLRLETLIATAAASGSTVLLTGETGCGKEEVARALHAAGARAAGPFVAINCGAMAASLVESQLFGHEKGSFTGAYGNSLGVFRAGHGGIVFLDEIGEMPLELQPRLLRVLQEREVMPVGSNAVHAVDVQLIAATNRDLAAAVSRGEFREDLLYRLNTLEIEVPPLRDRVDDIPLFISQFSERIAERLRLPPWQPDADTIRRLQRYHWPGNVRQLAQTVERRYVLGFIPGLPDEGCPPPIPSMGEERESQLPVLKLEALRRLAVRQALELTDGHKGRAAALLGVHLNTMTRLVEEAAVPPGRRPIGRPRLPRQPR